jgi:L-iditol 2-dehydrogenase
LHGDYTLCQQFHKTSIIPGGFAEYFKVPAANVQTDTLKIPQQLTFEEATFIEPIGCCLRAIRKCDVQIGDSVAVIGVGTAGIIHTALSKICGAAKTIVSDLIAFRLDLAKKFGADIAINPKKTDLTRTVMAETDRRGVDIVIVTAPSLEAYQAGIDVCRKGGRLCVFAPTDPRVHLQISPEKLFFSEIQIIPSYSTSHLETRIALQLLKSGKINVRELITHRFQLGEISKAFQTALEVKESLKVMVLN